MRNKKFIVLIIYDIVDNKRRTKMVKILEYYGTRVQKSAFEALLDKKKYELLIKKISPIIDKQTDSLRIYILDDIVNIYTFGTGEYKKLDCIIL